jgi:hypothetical protein
MAGHLRSLTAKAGVISRLTAAGLPGRKLYLDAQASEEAYGVLCDVGK